MSASKVDVLAVMGRSQRRYATGSRASQEMSDARAAVAELIAAGIEWDDALQTFANDGQPANFIRYTDAEARWKAALAAVKGGTP